LECIDIILRVGHIPSAENRMSAFEWGKFYHWGGWMSELPSYRAHPIHGGFIGNLRVGKIPLLGCMSKLPPCGAHSIHREFISLGVRKIPSSGHITGCMSKLPPCRAHLSARGFIGSLRVGEIHQQSTCKPICSAKCKALSSFFCSHECNTYKKDLEECICLHESKEVSRSSYIG